MIVAVLQVRLLHGAYSPHSERKVPGGLAVLMDRQPPQHAKKGASPLPFFARDGINFTNCIILHYPVGLVLSLSMPTGYASLAQWVERSAVNRNVTGSSPVGWVASGRQSAHKLFQALTSNMFALEAQLRLGFLFC